MNSSTYTVVVGGAGNASNGSVTLSMAAGGATDVAGNGNTASTSTDNSITWDTVAPTLTLQQGFYQSDPTSGSTIVFRLVSNEDLSTGSITAGDFTLTNGVITGFDWSSATASISSIRILVTASAQGVVSIAPSAAFSVADVAGNATSATTAGSDRSVTFDSILPTFTLTQASTQVDPTSGSSIRFSLTSGETIDASGVLDGKQFKQTAYALDRASRKSALALFLLKAAKEEADVVEEERALRSHALHVGILILHDADHDGVVQRRVHAACSCISCCKMPLAAWRPA